MLMNSEVVPCVCRHVDVGVRVRRLITVHNGKAYLKGSGFKYTVHNGKAYLKGPTQR